MDDVYGDYWDVPVCSIYDQIDARYVSWLLMNLGYAGPKSWEWTETRHYPSRSMVYTVRFRKEEDALAFKLRFGL